MARFNDIATQDRDYPKVGIVGEIYVKYNSFSNNHVAQWLMEQGVEVVVPNFLEFFLGLVCQHQCAGEGKPCKRRNRTWLLANLLERRVQGVLEQAEAIMADFKYYRPSHTIHEIARAAAGDRQPDPRIWRRAG